MTAKDACKSIQQLLHVAEDGVIGPKTLSALTSLSELPDDAPWPSLVQDGHIVGGVRNGKATSFADPADVAAFQRCKEQGYSDLFCFSNGDNGIGKWGDDCKAGSGPACALPPEDWAQFGQDARKKLVRIFHGESVVVAELRDTMPHKANIHNGAIIDLNPDACESLGISIPADAQVGWEWV